MQNQQQTTKMAKKNMKICLFVWNEDEEKKWSLANGLKILIQMSFAFAVDGDGQHFGLFYRHNRKSAKQRIFFRLSTDYRDQPEFFQK